MQTLTSILNFFASIAWSGVALYLLGWRFREPIVSLIGRIQKIGPGGAELIPEQRGEDARQLEAPQTPPATFTPLFQTLIDSGRERITNLAGANNPAARETAALWLYARAWIMRTHELNYRVIFGSQLRALRFMNEHPDGVPNKLTEIYEAAFNTPELTAEISYERWEAFLTGSSGLAERRDGRLFITEAGRSFLTHIIEHGYPENRAL